MLSTWLTDIKLVGNIDKKRDHFFVVHVDDEAVVKSEERYGIVPILWQQYLRFDFHPSSTIQFKLFRHSIFRFLGPYEIGHHTCKATRLLENNTVTLNFTDDTQITLASLNIKLSLITDPAEDIMRQVDADLERLDDNGVLDSTSGHIDNAMAIAQTGGDAAKLNGSCVQLLGMALQMLLKVMDNFADAHPIVKVSWVFISAVYKTVRARKIREEAVIELAKLLREMVGAAAEFPYLRTVSVTTDVIEEICRASLEVASFIDEYTRISSAVRADTFKLTDGMKSRIDQIQKNCQDIIKKIKNQRSMVLDVQERLQAIENIDLAKDISKWLNAPDCSRNYKDARTRHQAGTGSWFIDGENFSTWKNSGGFLCIYGKAGCGKTILCSSTIAHVFDICKREESSACAYFFFDGRDAQGALQSHDRFIRSVIQQLTDQCGGIPACLARLYGSGHQQPADALEDVLQEIIRGFKNAYIIIDALDECADRHKVVAWINKFIASTDGKLHLLSTSRPEREIFDKLESPHAAPIFVEDESVQDIETYIESKIQTDLHKWDEYNRKKIKDTLLNGAHGVFRWVALQLEELRGCSSAQALEDQLRSLPDGLDETYDRILSRIKESRRGDARRFLIWMAFSKTTLTPAEISEVVVVDLEAPNGPVYDPTRKYRDQKDVLVACSGLITNTQGFMKLAHFSVKDYLVSERTANGASKYFSINENLGHLLLAETCLAYLLHFDSPEPLKHDTYPLARYAAASWVFHVREGGGEGAPTIQKLIIALLESESTLTNWIRLWDPEETRRDRHESLMSEDVAEPLYYASQLGFVWASKKLLEDGACVNARGARSTKHGNALQAACYEGYGDVVDLLMKKGADVNIRGGEYGYALHAACHRGRISIVKMLLEAGANVNVQVGKYGSALHVAACHGDTDVVTLLLDQGADIHLQGGKHGSALHAAACEGHVDVVKLLLDRGANINLQGGKHGTALHAAAFHSDTDVIKLLLDRGVDINAQTGEDGTALHAAACQGDAVVVKLLLDRGADINISGDIVGSPLQVAIAGGKPDIVRLLLDSEADVNIHGGLFSSPLQAAIMKRDERTVKLLLNNHADVNAQGGMCGSALLCASALGVEGIVKLLLQHHADVNARVRDFTGTNFTGSPLTIMTLFQEKEADMDVEGDYGYALQAASHRGHTNVVKILLDNGADVSAHGGKYSNALQAALAGGHSDIVGVLLEHKATRLLDR